MFRMNNHRFCGNLIRGIKAVRQKACSSSRAAQVYDRDMEAPAAADLTAFILAGGKSTRMGRDKAFVNFNGSTLLARALDLVRQLTGNVHIVGSREKFVKFAPVVEDIFRDCGPLGGIHAALRASQTDFNLMLAVDMPFVSLSFLNYLAGQARNAPSATAVVPRTDGRWQPLCAIYRRDFVDSAEAALIEGRNKIGSLLEKTAARGIEQQEMEMAGFSAAIFSNLNTPEELESESQRAGHPTDSGRQHVRN